MGCRGRAQCGPYEPGVRAVVDGTPCPGAAAARGAPSEKTIAAATGMRARPHAEEGEDSSGRAAMANQPQVPGEAGRGRSGQRDHESNRDGMRTTPTSAGSGGRGEHDSLDDLAP